MVLLPTPPLPEATAMMFLTFGSSSTPRCTAWATTLVAMLTETFCTPATPLAAAISAVRRAGDLALGRVAQFDVEGDVAVVDLQVLERFGADEILAGVGVDDGREGL